ncbi:MAG: glycosyltransferase family 9 protein [Gemmobacter sp.]
MNISEVKFDCRHFRGELPCTPNKLSGCICTNCTHYDKITKRILIIKLGAIGDVIRTTPLVEKYRTLYPGCHITWITHTPDILPKKEIDSILSFSFTSVYTLSHKHFDIAINLDKDQEACMLLADINAIEKFGFIWRDGHLNTANNLAEHKIITGLFDNESKINTKRRSPQARGRGQSGQAGASWIETSGPKPPYHHLAGLATKPAAFSSTCA